MQWSDIPFNPPKRTLRQFAGLWLAFFGGLACWQHFLRGNPGPALVLVLLALAVGPVGLVRPQAVRWLYVGWMVLAFPIGWTVSRVLMAVVFYGVFTPIGLLLRLAGRDAMGRNRRQDRPTYWEPKPAAAGPRSYLQQF